MSKATRSAASANAAVPVAPSKPAAPIPASASTKRPAFRLNDGEQLFVLTGDGRLPALDNWASNNKVAPAYAGMACVNTSNGGLFYVYADRADDMLPVFELTAPGKSIYNITGVEQVDAHPWHTRFPHAVGLRILKNRTDFSNSDADLSDLRMTAPITRTWGEILLIAGEPKGLCGAPGFRKGVVDHCVIVLPSQSISASFTALHRTGYVDGEPDHAVAVKVWEREVVGYAGATTCIAGLIEGNTELALVISNASVGVYTHPVTSAQEISINVNPGTLVVPVAGAALRRTLYERARNAPPTGSTATAPLPTPVAIVNTPVGTYANATVWVDRGVPFLNRNTRPYSLAMHAKITDMRGRTTVAHLISNDVVRQLFPAVVGPEHNLADMLTRATADERGDLVETMAGRVLGTATVDDDGHLTMFLPEA